MIARLSQAGSLPVLASLALMAFAGLQAQTFGEEELHFPQVIFGDGSQTAFVVHNPNAEPLLVSRRLFEPDGTPVGGFEEFSVQPLGTFILELPPDGPLSVGHMEFTAAAPFTATAFIQLRVAGELRPLVGAQPSPLASQTRFFGFGGEELRSGMALANPADDSTTVSVRLFGMAGQVVHTTEFQLGPFAQRAVFLDELFPDLHNFDGVVDVSAQPLPVSLISLVQDKQGNIATVTAVIAKDQ